MVNGIEHIEHNFNIQISFSLLSTIILNYGFHGLSFKRKANTPKKIQEPLLTSFRRCIYTYIINGIYNFASSFDKV